MSVIGSDVHVDDYGTIFRVWFKDGGVVVDISLATTKDIYLKPPGTASTGYAGTFITDGTDGGLYYTSGAGVLTTDGEWAIQGHFITPSGSWKSQVRYFDVLPNI